MIKIGGTEITDIAVGSTPIEKAYIGSTLVWEKSSPVLPYDAEIEYIQSNGTQYIDTNVGGTGTFTSARIIIDAQFTSITSRCLTGASNGFYFGVNNSRWEASYNHYVSGANTNRHTFEKKLLKPKSHIFYLDGVTKNTWSTTVSDDNYGYTVYLFAMNSGNSPLLFCQYKLYSAKIYINDVLLFDAIPVRKSQVGCLYDRVSGGLFYNLGSGSFPLGPDVT